jgi:hypothetical protein
MKYGTQDIIDVKLGLHSCPVYYGGINHNPAHNPAKIYGVSWDKGETPDLTRTDDAVGMVANVGIDDAVVVNDFDNAEIYKDIAEVTDDLGNVFIRIPKFYIRKTDGVNSLTTQISRMPFSGCYLPWSFWDFTNSRELPYVDIGKYPASLDGAKLASKADTFPLTNQNIVQMRTLAQANGAGYQQMDIHAHDIISALFDVEFATLNSQAILMGFTYGQFSASHVATATETAVTRIIVANSTAALYRVGQSIGIGTSLGGTQIASYRVITAISDYDPSNKAISFDGAAVTVTAGNILHNMGWKNGFSSNIVASSGALTANDGKYPMAYRGIENLYGNVRQFVDGVNITDSQTWVCDNADQFATYAFASPYKQLSYANVAKNGFAVAMGHDSANPFAQFPTNVTGGAYTKYYCDYYSQAAGARIAHFGGNWNSGSDGGLRCWSFADSSSAADLRFSARLVRKAV